MTLLGAGRILLGRADRHSRRVMIEAPNLLAELFSVLSVFPGGRLFSGKPQ